MTVKRAGVFLLALSLGACAMQAPPLPADTTGSTSTHRLSANDFSPQDTALYCGEIGTQRAALHKGIDQASANIAANRQNNQVAGYFGALFVLPLVATEGNYNDKDIIKAAYARLDTLNQLAVYRSCPE
jgi:hypothetical protein